MLLELRVKNFAIIQDIQIEFKSGLNIISGETGAGKSILLKSLALLMGSKASSESVRDGCNQAHIEGLFDLTDRADIKDALNKSDIEYPDSILIVRRILSPNGKSRIYINETPVTLSLLQKVVAPLIELTGQTAPLIEMTGQFENRSLLNKSYHLDLLDHFSGTLKLREKFKTNYEHQLGLMKRIKELEELEKEKFQRYDFLVFQKSEIEKLNLTDFNEEEIETKYSRSKLKSKLASILNESLELLDNERSSPIQLLGKVSNRLSEIAVHFQEIESIVEKIQDSKSLAEEASFELDKIANQSIESTDELENIEEQINLLRNLQRKFGNETGVIQKTYEKICSELSRYEELDDQLESLRDDLIKQEKITLETANELHKARNSKITGLKNKVNTQLKELNMKGVIFEIHISQLKNISFSGNTEVEFMIRPSQSSQPKPINKIASGGELSRLLLSLKQVIGEGEIPRTYLFDEVDTGVSGPTAEQVGRKLRVISEEQQVICVTHLPQVAAFGEHHYLIEKHTDNKNVKMIVRKLSGKERTSEIARLISGSKVSKTSLAHADNLIKDANI